ncbi:MAG: hypothetical protein ACE5DS_07950 [Kiloniellaceae bacterium]
MLDQRALRILVADGDVRRAGQWELILRGGARAPGRGVAGAVDLESEILNAAYGQPTGGVAIDLTIACSPDEAVEAIRRCARSAFAYGLALVDMDAWPKSVGRGLARAIRARDPAIALVLAATLRGGPVAEFGAWAVPASRVFMLPKPFSARAARRLIAAILPSWYGTGSGAAAAMPDESAPNDSAPWRELWERL